MTKRPKLWRGTDREAHYDQVLRAAVPLEAARIAFDHADELGVHLNTLEVSPLVEPEGNRAGLCYEAAVTHHYVRDHGRIRRHTSGHRRG
ncbi:MAG: hypothetical protein ACHRHE_07000 [Tepidisphaerales bacterium]